MSRYARLVLVVGLVWGGAPALALPGTSFEGSDGNLIDEAQYDWQSFMGSSDLEIGVDLPTGQNDDSLSGKEDEVAPGITFGSIPNQKSDLLRFYLVHENLDAGGGESDDFLYIAWVRSNTLGTANMDFEFNQADQLSANDTTPVRTAGDMLVTFAFASGGNQVILGLSRWTDSGPCESANSGPCWGPIMPLGGVAEGAFNSGPVLDPIEGVMLAESTFGEAMINLTDAGVFDRDECTTFGKAYVKSRSSSSFTSQMKDFIQPIDVSVTNCATVRIAKDAVPDGPQDFNFLPSPELNPTSFDLDDDGDEANELASSRSFEVPINGTLTVTEQPVAGWDLTDVSCTGSATPELDGNGDFTGLVSLDTSIGESIDCTFTNTQRGRILVLQDTDPAGDLQVFDFSLSGDGVAQSFGLADASAAYDSGFVRAGPYDVTQLGPPAGWDLTSASCDDGSSPAAVMLAPGETVTCTFLNTKRGMIVVDQITDPPGDSQQFDFTLDGNGVNQAFGLTDADAPYASGLIEPGLYDVTQLGPPAGWDLTSATCDDGSSPGSLTLGPGDTVTCTFVNTKRGRIFVEQETDPAGDPQVFDFTLTGGAANQTFGLTDAGAAHDSGLLEPDTYDVTQLGPPVGWDLTSATCDDGSPPGAVMLGAGETVTCTFTNTKRGAILVEQETDPDGDPQIFDFTLTGPGTNQSFGLADTDAAHDSGLLEPGSYDVTQLGPPVGWDLTSATCDDGSAPGAVALAPGEIVTCTFTNTKRGTILVAQATDPSGDAQVFDFTLTGGPDAVNQAFGLADGDPEHDSSLVRPGTYDVTQLGPPVGWDLTSATCDDGSAPAAIGLDPGETVTCTFTNTKRGTVLVRQVTDPSGDAQIFDFTLDGGPDGVNQAFGLADGDPDHDSGLVRPGTYDVTQLGPPVGWDLTSATCDDGSAPGAVDLDPGETVTCTFTNTKRGAILVAQVTDPAGDPQIFDFTLTGGPDAVNQAFGLADGDPQHDSGLVRPGAYDVTQLGPPVGWDLTSATCDDGSPPGAVGLDPGETVTCTFTNTKRGTIFVAQVTDPSGDPQVFDFTLTGTTTNQAFGLADGDPAHDGGLLVPDTYDVTQLGPPVGWDLTSATCDDGSAPAAVGLEPGETVTCTFTNTKRGAILVAQVTDPADDPQIFDFTLTGGPDAVNQPFGLADGDPAHDSGLVRPGTYDATQLGPPVGWDLTSATCDDGSAPNAIGLAPGETVTCTFTNTKRGTILVAQVTDPADDPQIFDFTLTGGSDAVNQAFGLADGDPEHDSGLVRPGTYDVTQLGPPAGWDLTSATCDDGSMPGAIGLAPGETVTCTFTNTKRGTILVAQVTDPSGDPQIFDFTLSGGPDAVNQSFGLADEDPDHDSGLVRPGTYDVTQLGPPVGWDLTSATCDDGSAPGAIGLAPGETVTCTFTNTKRGTILVDQVTNPSGESQLFDFTLSGGPDAVNQSFGLADGDPAHDSGLVRPGGYDVTQLASPEGWDLTSATCDDGSAPGELTLDPGETVTCAFVNTKRATLIVVKNAIPDDAQDFDFSLDGAYSAGFQLDDDGEEAVLPTSTSFSLAHGPYVVSQADPGPAWDPTGLTCDGAVDTIDLGSRTAWLDLQPGDVISCVFTDTKRGRVITEKFVVNESTGSGFDPRDYPFEFDPSWGPSFWLAHGETEDSSWLPAGQSYTVSESGVRGWVTSSICLYPDGSAASGGSSVSIDLEPAAEVYCTFTNEMRIHPGSAGFWRNWRNHYVSDEFLSVIVEALRESPVHAGLFDASGDPLPNIISLIDDIYDNGMGSEEQPVLRELTTTLLNLAVSKSEDPAIRALQKNDDICRDCTIDVSPAEQQLLDAWGPCIQPGGYTIGDVIDTADATWTGLMPATWEFAPLTSGELTLLQNMLEGINNGRTVDVDPSGYPDTLTCLSLPGGRPSMTVWYLDNDGDGYGSDIVIETCEFGPPAGYAADGGDCDDAKATVNPGASEVCDGLDNDCDGTADAGLDGDGDNVDDLCDAFPADAARSGSLYVASSGEFDDSWSTVALPSTYQDPIVIVGPASQKGPDSGVVQIDQIAGDSFDIRYKEWLYLDGVHQEPETASFLVMERGRYLMNDGSLWEWGSFTLPASWPRMKAQSFMSPFPLVPSVFLTAQTADGNPVAVRARNVSESGFEAGLFQEEALMGFGDSAEVGYLAIYRPKRSGYVTANQTLMPYLMRTESVGSRNTPVLSWTLRSVEERSQDEGIGHLQESIEVLALGSHLFAQDISTRDWDTISLRRLDPEFSAPMEWGTINDVGDRWLTIPLARSYTDPVVIVKPLSNTMAEPGVVRLLHVAGDSFQVRFNRWEGDTNGDRERVFYLVAEAGQHQLAEMELRAGTLDTNATVDLGMWETIDLGSSFPASPAVFASVQSFNSAASVTTRVTDRTATGFRLSMQEGEGDDGIHVVETLGWIAIEPGSGATDDGRNVKIFNELIDSAPRSVAFAMGFARAFPVMVGDIASSFEMDPCTLRYDNLTRTQVELFVEEEQTLDAEMQHLTEEVSLFVAE